MSGRRRLAVVGAGAMGAQHARIISSSDRAEVSAIVDQDLSRAQALASATGATGSTDLEAATRCDGAVLATPTATHTRLALLLLDAGVPLLIEKPIAADIDDVDEVLQAADRADVPLMCGFVERFNPAVTTALALLAAPPHHVTAIRHSPHTPRATSSVVWDLLIHDIDLALRCNADVPVAHSQASAWTPEGGEVAEVADCLMTFTDGMLASLSSSRAGQRKIRGLSLAGRDAMIEVDLLRADVTVYRHVRQEQITQRETTYRAETIVDIPFVRHAGEPLALQLEHFLDLIVGEADPAAERATLRAPHEIAADVERVTR